MKNIIFIAAALVAFPAKAEKATLGARVGICADYSFWGELCKEGDDSACYYLEDAIRNGHVCPSGIPDALNALSPKSGTPKIIHHDDGTVTIPDDVEIIVE